MGSEKNKLLEFLERSVRGKHLAQSNRASIPDFGVPQTAKPQKSRKNKLCQISQNIAAAADVMVDVTPQRAGENNMRSML